MKTRTQYSAEVLRELFYTQRIATLEQLKGHLGTKVDVTVFRKLKELGYYSSYSHNGRYYTLEEVARFDEFGLWSHDSVCFSFYGTLQKTVQALVEMSQKGYFVSELNELLHVETKHPLRHLYENGILHREKVTGKWLYGSVDLDKQAQQLSLRQKAEALPKDLSEEVLPDEVKASILLFYSLLDEKMRRLYAGLEALKYGHGGARRIASFLGLDEKTVAKGRKELLEQNVEKQGVRRPGAGRWPVKKGLRK